MTLEGQVLLPKLEQWVRQLHDLIISKEEISLRVATTHAIAQIAVPALLSFDRIDFQHMRPDRAYDAIVRNEADLALVLDNAPWKGVSAAEVGKGQFQLYSKAPHLPMRSVLLPEDRMEVLSLQQNWYQEQGYALPIKSRIPSWSLIAAICAESEEVGFLPDFLAKKYQLHPVSWQPAASQYRILAIYSTMQPRIDHIVTALRKVFS